MDSSPIQHLRLTELPQPDTIEALERTFQGFQAALATLSIPELMELSAKQASLLETENRNLVSGLLSDWNRSALDSPVQSSMPTELPSRPEPVRAGPLSLSQPLFPPRRRSRSAEAGAGMAARLAARSSRKHR